MQRWERGAKVLESMPVLHYIPSVPDSLFLTLEWEKLNINEEALALANSFYLHITSICIKTFKALSTIHICYLIYFCNIHWARGGLMLSPFSKWKMWSAKGWRSKSKENQNSGYNTKKLFILKSIFFTCLLARCTLRKQGWFCMHIYFNTLLQDRRVTRRMMCNLLLY